jgi:hypothetical protein
MAAKVYKPEYPGLYYFDTFTFTTLGTSGHRGPDSIAKFGNVCCSKLIFYTRDQRIVCN